jgi:hypothetical protein
MNIFLASIFRKIQTNNYRQTTPSASMLTCRRRPADTPQTLTQTLPLTLVDQNGFWSILFDGEVENIL